ncbi:MAG: lipopolysaccharide core heptose(I) kinase RfaP [Thermodesulfobacteriota bacterium]|nr:lipopolysaccharide core heptose(I) kinase RfaP [Thermodesulfobacteriota bacterium]
MIVLPKEWKAYWKINENDFGELFNVKGEIFSSSQGRKTLRFKFKDKYYFGKFHTGVGWGKIIKNIVQFRRPPVLGAENEWKALEKLDRIGIDTMQAVGYGRLGWNPASYQSFVITHELKDTITLENFCRDWADNPPSPELKRSLIREIAKIARKIHENGINHRDFYLCHFLLDISKGLDAVDPKNIRLFLVDLHRAQIRSKTPFRWRAKDVFGLLFSSMDLGLTQRDMMRFARVYFNTDTKTALTENRFFWWVVQKRAHRLYRKIFKKDPPDIL